MDEKLEQIPNYDFHQYYITPGIIDMNVQLNAGYTFDESWIDIENITSTAISGGVTTIVNHPLFTNSPNIQ